MTSMTFIDPIHKQYINTIYDNTQLLLLQHIVYYVQYNTKQPK